MGRRHKKEAVSSGGRTRSQQSAQFHRPGQVAADGAVRPTATDRCDVTTADESPDFDRTGDSRGTRSTGDTGDELAGIRIELQPVALGGFINGRHELWLRGRIISAVRMKCVSLATAEGRLSATEYPWHHGGSVPISPPNPTLEQYPFAVAVARSKSDAATPASCIVTAQSREEVSHQASFRIEVDPADCTRGFIVSSQTSRPGSQADAVPPVILYVEEAVIDPDGRLLVGGWVLTLGAIAAVQVFADGRRLGVAQIGRPRADVALAHPRFPNAGSSGFLLDTRLDQASTTIGEIRVEAITLQGFVQEIWVTVEHAESRDTSRQPQNGSLVPDPRREINLCCEEISLLEDGQLTISGWAVCAAGISRAEVRLDGEAVGDADLGLPRPDVAGEFKRIPMARFSGLHFTRPAGTPIAGIHEISLLVHNGLDDVRAESRTIEASPAEPSSQREELLSAAQETAVFQLQVETPSITGGAVLYPVSGMLTIQGWSFAEQAEVTIGVFVDEVAVGEAHYGLPRPDVAEAFPPYANAMRSGFIFRCPLEPFPDGEHMVRIQARTPDGACAAQSFRITVRHDGSVSNHIQILRRVPPAKARLYADLLHQAVAPPAFQLILRASRSPDLSLVGTTLASLARQIYGNWGLTVAAQDSATRNAIRDLATAWGQDFVKRLNFIRPGDTSFAAASHRPRPKPAASERNTLFGFLCPGDELGCDALAEIALYSARRSADIIYADEARISPVSGQRAGFFKPDWSPDLLLSTNYIGRPWFVAAKTLAAAGVTPHSLRHDGEYDAVLRCMEQARTIEHLAKLLCWRGPAALDEVDQERRALQRAAERQRLNAHPVPTCIPGTWRLRRTLVESKLVSIIVPTCAKNGHIKQCIDTLRAKTVYRNYEIVCIDNIHPASADWKAWLRRNADLVVDMPAPFNWSRFNNTAAQSARGDYLLFLNDDIEVTQADWLDAMLEHAQRPDVGVVGPQLLYPDGKVQHAGMFLATLGTARHAFRMLANDDPGYFGLALTQRNVIAVTGACMLVRRQHFQKLGGFDESHMVINNDLDYCLRSHKAGLLTVFTPYATLLHHEAASRVTLKESFDQGKFEYDWRRVFTEGDPFFNLRLSRQSDDYRPDDEPVQDVFAGGALFRPEEIRQILVLKLDHIGDFITAIPAIRRLKQLFPHASLRVLTGKTNAPMAKMEPDIDGIIEFEFFHARSELGPKALIEANFNDLATRLAPYDFDLAVDLRRHPDTRHVLRHVPARYRAGFDHAGQFPFMDISLEASEDIPLRHKNTHVSDVLLQLVEAIGQTCHRLLPPPTLVSPPSPNPALDRLPAHARRLFQKSVAALHPGVGSSARQWPPAHFAALADLLVKENGLNVVLIGNADERPIAEAVLEKVMARDSVASIAGKTTLQDLPALLQSCALYVGNNSGPQHMAAALGIPTIGVHSGAVDATEWGPVGARAVALQRRMLCSPCYLTKAEDCVRNMACLKQLEPALVHQYCNMLLDKPTGSRHNKGAASPSLTRRSQQR